MLRIQRHWKNWAKGMEGQQSQSRGIDLYLKYLAGTVHSKSAMEEAHTGMGTLYCRISFSIILPLTVQRMVEDAKVSGTLTDLRLTTAYPLNPLQGFFSKLVKI